MEVGEETALAANETTPPVDTERGGMLAEVAVNTNVPFPPDGVIV